MYALLSSHYFPITQQQQSPLYGHYTRQPALVGTSSEELENSVGTQLQKL